MNNQPQSNEDEAIAEKIVSAILDVKTSDGKNIPYSFIGHTRMEFNSAKLGSSLKNEIIKALSTKSKLLEDAIGHKKAYREKVEELQSSLLTANKEIERLKAPLSDRSIEELARDYLAVSELQEKLSTTNKQIEGQATHIEFLQNENKKNLDKLAVANEVVEYVASREKCGKLTEFIRKVSNATKVDPTFAERHNAELTRIHNLAKEIIALNPSNIGEKP